MEHRCRQLLISCKEGDFTLLHGINTLRARFSHGFLNNEQGNQPKYVEIAIPVSEGTTTKWC